MLPDVLEKNLRVVICGTAVATHSAKVGSYYAGSNNKFWKVLYNTGLTTELIPTERYTDLLQYGIGLTDLVKNKAGTDNKLVNDDFDRIGFRNKMLDYDPRIICFNGKKAAEVYLNKQVNYGLQSETIGKTILFVAPSTSGAAGRFWNESFWQELSKMY